MSELLTCLLSAARRDSPERGWGYSVTFGVDSIFVLTQRSEDFAELADMLLNHGADVNSEKAGGSTPFRLASQGGLAEVTLVLQVLEHGADPGKMAASGLESLAVTSSAHPRRPSHS
jgi:hypothetical protein